MINQEFIDIEQAQHKHLKNKFANYCQTVLFPLLKQKEQIRVKYLNRFWFLVLLGLIFLPMLSLLIYFLNHYYHKNIDWGIFYFCIACMIFIIRAPFSTYHKKVKKDIMEVFANFFEKFSYCQGAGLSSDELQNSRVFPSFTFAMADDCFKGVYNGVNIHICEEFLKKRVYNSKGKFRDITVFQGVAVELDMNKKFSGHTIVLKDAGIFNTIKRFNDMQPVKLEDIVFENLFEVYSTNQIEARYLLTSGFMERVLELKKLYQGKKVEISFYDNKILIAIDTRENMFEACSFFKSNLNKKKIDSVFEQFWTILSIVHILKLNEKLGL